MVMSNTSKEREKMLPPKRNEVGIMTDKEAKVSNEGHSSEPTKKRDEIDESESDDEDLARYQPLRWAIYKKDWKAVENFINNNPQALTANITEEGDSIFNIIVYKSPPIWLLKKLASSESIAKLKGPKLESALYDAARSGNREAAKIFLDQDKDLMANIMKSDKVLPIEVAARFGHKETFKYLLSETTKCIDGKRGLVLLKYLIDYSIYGTALDLLKENPMLAREQAKTRGMILELLAKKPNAFKNGSQLGCWQRLIYHYIPVEEEYSPCYGSVNEDEENPNEPPKNFKKFTPFGALFQNLNIMLWKALLLAPSIKNIRHMKLTHIQTVEMVRMMCGEANDWSDSEAYVAFNEAILTAAKFGIYEIVNEIIKAYPDSLCSYDKNGRGIFDLAVQYRHEKVFNLIYEVGDANVRILSMTDIKNDNILHLAAKLGPSTQVGGAALQMQRELQWYKAVKDIFHPSFEEQRNSFNETPKELFAKEHKKLVKEGERWMKEIASWCTIVATIIISVVFAAASTISGDNNPNILDKQTYGIFAISNMFAIFSSFASLIMFLDILTSRYTEQDFLEYLPRKLIIGLITLLFSIGSMIVASCATFYMLLSPPWKWLSIPLALLSCLQVGYFLCFRSALVGIISSTYGPSIFGPMKDI